MKKENNCRQSGEWNAIYKTSTAASILPLFTDAMQSKSMERRGEWTSSYKLFSLKTVSIQEPKYISYKMRHQHKDLQLPSLASGASTHLIARPFHSWFVSFPFRNLRCRSWPNTVPECTLPTTISSHSLPLPELDWLDEQLQFRHHFVLRWTFNLVDPSSKSVLLSDPIYVQVYKPYSYFTWTCSCI